MLNSSVVIAVEITASFRNQLISESLHLLSKETINHNYIPLTTYYCQHLLTPISTTNTWYMFSLIVLPFSHSICSHCYSRFIEVYTQQNHVLLHLFPLFHHNSVFSFDFHFRSQIWDYSPRKFWIKQNNKSVYDFWNHQFVNYLLKCTILLFSLFYLLN